VDLSTLCFEHSPVCVGVEQQLAGDAVIPHGDRTDLDFHDALVPLARHLEEPYPRQIGRDLLDVCEHGPRLGNGQRYLEFVIQVHLLTSLAKRINRSCFAWYSP
jgi:hypothetical protein